MVQFSCATKLRQRRLSFLERPAFPAPVPWRPSNGTQLAGVNQLTALLWGSSHPQAGSPFNLKFVRLELVWHGARSQRWRSTCMGLVPPARILDWTHQSRKTALGTVEETCSKQVRCVTWLCERSEPVCRSSFSVAIGHHGDTKRCNPAQTDE